MSQPADARFRNVEVQFQTLKSQLASGALTPEQFEAALQSLMILDEQGRYWMMGAESGRWYVYENQNWIQRDPPGFTPAAPAAVTPAPSAASPRPDAVTLTSFTPPISTEPQPAPLRPDQAATLVGFTPPQVPVQPSQGAAVPPAAPPLDDTTKRGGLSPVLLMALLFIAVCIVGVIAVGFAGYSRFFGAAAQLPTGTPAPTQTQAPPAATALPPTTTPTRAPTTALTAAPTSPPQRTPPVIIIPTVPPLPTATNTPPPPPPPTATDTPVPPPPPPPTATRTPVPQFGLTFNFQGYERWGTPDTTCATFNDRVPAWQFKWDVTVVNRSTAALNPGEWETAAFSNDGAQAKVCTVNLSPIPAGQTARATFAAYIRYDGSNRLNFVQRVVHRIRNAAFQRCLDTAWKETPC